MNDQLSWLFGALQEGLLLFYLVQRPAKLRHLEMIRNKQEGQELSELATQWLRTSTTLADAVDPSRTHHWRPHYGPHRLPCRESQQILLYKKPMASTATTDHYAEVFLQMFSCFQTPAAQDLTTFPHPSWHRPGPTLAASSSLCHCARARLQTRPPQLTLLLCLHLWLAPAPVYLHAIDLTPITNLNYHECSCH